MNAPYPFSAGDAMAQTTVPPNACDCHIHVYDDAVAPVAGARLRPPAAGISDYRRIQTRMGTQRAVLVTPSTYGSNNTPMLKGLAQMGAQARGVAVIDGHESDATLNAMHRQGVRGVRINLSLGQGPKADAIETIAQRIATLGWHLQLLMPIQTLLELAPVLRRLKVDLVFDHFARLSPELQMSHPAHTLLTELLDSGHAWLKISGGYLVSTLHSVDDPGLATMARHFITVAPERIVWGSDWPHATASAGHHPYPDDARQMDRLAQWAGSAETLRQILVTNPACLYGFESLAP
jgi:predicted TIM-barrel fold metal-dependent hydrolase